MRKSVCVTLCVTVLLAGCAGRTAQPVSIYQPGDQQRTAESIQAELVQIDSDIKAKESNRQGIVLGNVALGVLGFFLLFPWFFMDFKDADGTEIEALKQRKTWLTSIMTEGRSASPALGQTAPADPAPAAIRTPPADQGRPLYRPGWDRP